MRFLKILGGLLVGLVAVFVVVGFVLPSNTQVERMVEIDAPPCTVYALVDGFRRFDEISPWAALDPGVRPSFDGPAWGVGAAMRWKSRDPRVGEAKMAVVAAEACRRVDQRIEFEDTGHADLSWRIEPREGGSRVAWTLRAEFGNDLVLRWLGPLFERSVGADLASALARLEAVAEAAPKVDFEGFDPAIEGSGRTRLLTVEHVGPDVARSRERLAAWMVLREIRAAGEAREEPVSDPATTPPGELVTRIVVPIR